MAFWEDAFEGSFGTSLGVGIGVAVVAPILMPVLGGVLRPVAKAAIKGGLVLVEAGREGVGRLNEMSGDIVAEAQSELETSRRQTAHAGGQGGSAARTGAKT